MDNSFESSTNKDVTHGRGYVYSLMYHIVWCTKYREQIFMDNLETELSDYLRKTSADLQIDILAMDIMPDYIHMLVSCKPQLRLSDAIKVLKGNSARWLFLSHPEVKQKLRDGHLWNPSYFVVTASDRSEDQIRQYIETRKII